MEPYAKFNLRVLAGFFGLVEAYNFYQRRIRVVEAEYRLGVQREKICWGFTLELLIIVFMPIILSAFIGLLFLKFMNGFIYLDHPYSAFKPIVGWFQLATTCFLELLAILAGWLIGISLKVRNYQPIKQE